MASNFVRMKSIANSNCSALCKYHVSWAVMVPDLGKTRHCPGEILENFGYCLRKLSCDIAHASPASSETANDLGLSMKCCRSNYNFNWNNCNCDIGQFI